MPRRKNTRELEVLGSLKDLTRDLALKELEDIGLEKVGKLEKLYGPKDARVIKAKFQAFFRAYSIVGTVRYAAQVCGLNYKTVNKIIKNNEKLRTRFEQAHDEFCQYLEQTAILRAVEKSDTLLQFILRANNPHKFSERLRLQTLTEEKEKPVTIIFGEMEAGQGDAEPNFLEAADDEGEEDDGEEG